MFQANFGKKNRKQSRYFNHREWEQQIHGNIIRKICRAARDWAPRQTNRKKGNPEIRRANAPELAYMSQHLLCSGRGCCI